MILALLFLQAVSSSAIEPPASARPLENGAELYPIGWSPDGKFAYVIVDRPVFRDGYGFLWVIADAVTDEVLWTRYDHSDQFDWHGETAPLSIAWKRSVPALTAALAEFSVEAIDMVPVEPLPLRDGTDEYTAEISEQRVNPETSPYGNGVIGYTFTLRSKERGSKVLVRRAGLFTTDIRVECYIRSPFENRVVFLVAESGNAYGGARFTDYTIVGAHLDVGFE